MKEGINYELKDGKITVATYQSMEDDIFCRKLLNMGIQKENFKMQKDFSESEIKRSTESIEKAKENIIQMEKNIEMITSDVEKAYQFLKSIHREDLILKVDNEIETKKKEAEAQMAMHQQ